jgi:hypothetical protein
MSHPASDPLRCAAEQMADCISGRGFAFIEDDKIDALASMLESFLLAANITVTRAYSDSLPVGKESLINTPWTS